MKHYSLSTIKDKVYQVGGIISGTAIAGYTRGTTLCSDLFSETVTVSKSGLSWDKITGNVLTVIGGACTIIGVFMVASGVIKYLQARAEDNSTGESKAAGVIGIGLAFVVMPQILNLLFK